MAVLSPAVQDQIGQRADAAALGNLENQVTQQNTQQGITPHMGDNGGSFVGTTPHPQSIWEQIGHFLAAYGEIIILVAILAIGIYFLVQSFRRTSAQ